MFWFVILVINVKFIIKIRSRMGTSIFFCFIFRTYLFNLSSVGCIWWWSEKFFGKVLRGKREMGGFGDFRG